MSGIIHLSRVLLFYPNNMPTLFLVLLALPFLLILPGWFVTAVCFPASDRIEKSTLSVLLSMVIVYSSLFAVEKTAGKLTPLNTALTLATVNLVCGGIFVFARFWKLQRH